MCPCARRTCGCLCACGEINRDGERCHVCSQELDTLIAKLDVDRLREEKTERLRREEEHASAVDAVRDAHAKKAKKIALIAVPIALIAAAAIVFSVVSSRNARAYDDALALLDAGRYNEADVAFTKLGNYKDSAVKAEEAAGKGQENTAYTKACKLLEDGSFDEAQALYTELGDYCDSAEKADGFVQRKVSMTTSYDESCSGPLTTTYTYSSDGVLLSETRLYSEYPSMDDQTYEYEYAPDGSYTLTRDQVSSVYDDHGNLLGQGGVFQYDYVYEYYDDGTMSSCTALAEGSEDTLWIEEYDRHGSTDRYIEADGTAYDFVNTYKGNLLYQQDKYDASGALVGNIKYEYDGDGRLTKKTVIENGNVSKAVVTEFVYGYVYAPDAKAAEEAKKAAEEEAKLAAEAAAQSEEADSTEDAAETAEPEVTAEAVQ